MDIPTQQRIALLHPKLRDEVTTLVNQANALLTTHSHMRIVQGLRTFAEQDALFAQRPKVTQARGGQSLHNYGVAIDFALIIDDKVVSWDLKKDWDGDKIADWMEVVGVFRRAGWEWGGTWKFTDNPHFQKTFGHTWQQLLVKYNDNDFIAGTTYVNI
jgi:peptidoglycan L-alanyl-D-glutamate endopeptidase CwlK